MRNFTFNIKSVGLIFIIFILLAEYIIIPWFDWVDETKSAIETQQSKLAKQERLITKAEFLEQEREELTTEYIPKLSGLTIVKKDQDSAVIWLKEVEKHLAQYDVKINSKSPRREVDINEDFAVFSGRINVKGKYNEVINLLEKLENSQTGNRIRQLRLNSNKATPDVVVADIEFLKVFKRS